MFREGGGAVFLEPAGEVGALGLLDALYTRCVRKPNFNVRCGAVDGQGTAPDGLVEGHVVGVAVAEHLPVAAREGGVVLEAVGNVDHV